MKRLSNFLIPLFFIGGVGWMLPHPIAYAFKRADGTTTFTQPPFLVAASTPYPEAEAWNTTYFFTLDIPVNAGEPLQRVTFTQTEGSEPIRFDLKAFHAFEGTRKHQGPKLTLQPPTKGDRSSQQISVTFDPPVPPGKTVTIALQTIRNPLFDGIYLFGVTAFPPGEQAVGQFIGYGRLQFYRDVND
ncbi:MAG: DUF2808 domain-containing protein [Chroococcidiopsidaceae cyanobacterium CP_BM_ER_R8_30]|nr:DUF2808 domain-containing protein [Chroococcidiopsidaceae cyanobacterium CP_BM_ER_R8_30]